MTDHPLKDWLTKNEEAPYLFADRVGLSRSFVYGVIKNKFLNIGIVQAGRIELGTRGKVRPQTIFNYLLENGLIKETVNGR